MLKKRDKNISLSEKLSSLIQTKPSTVESDNEDLTTIDKIATNEKDSDFSADELDVSKFRKINSSLLEEEDKKYLGKSISRKDIDHSDDSEISENEGDSVSDTQDSSLEEEDYESEEVDEETGSEAENTTRDKEVKRGKVNKKKQEDSHFDEGILAKAGSDIEKGKAIRNQLHIWDFLLECRLKFQKCLLSSNQLPNYRDFPNFKNKGGVPYQESIVQCKKSLKHLLNSLLSLQHTLLSSNEEFLNLNKLGKKEAEDEEIPSSSEDEHDNIQNGKNDSSIKKLKNLNDFSTEISKRHENFENYRNNTIQKWNDKTRIGYISNKNFSAFEQSTLKQIEHVLLDKQRLIKRTQIKRSNYHILGEENQEPPAKKPAKSDDPSVDNKNKSLNKEIFDDDDFYHQLLSELVKRKASDITDPVQLGRQWMQLQKIRSKMKKTVDTRASKGRKVRFVVHPKLVNFMMPIDNSVYTEESRTELFNSLFGKTKSK